MRSRDINAFVRDDLARSRGLNPGATTLYRYRSTLHRLGLMSNQGNSWRVELADALVHTLIGSCPGESPSLVPQARVPFAEAVLRHPDCRALLFDLFMPDHSSALDFSAFSARSTPVAWRHTRKGKHSRLELWNRHTGESRCYEQEQAVLSVVYGLRYWVRDELEIVDEYAELGENAATLFPVSPVPDRERAREARVLDAVRFVLGMRSDGAQWTTFEVSELIRRYCVERRQARRILFSGISWLCRHRARSVVLVPTPVAVATLSASSSNREHLELTRYYRDARGRLIGDVRIHVDAKVP